ncbi:hypothetical protein [Nocardia sp. NPDC050412]|uniref:hypothetical protein n=1 Tax=Nocardia sp. NPDC050412 TaxID=3364320 RepID=UPI0037A0805D
MAAVLALVVIRKGEGKSELDKMKDAFPGLVQPVGSGVSGTGYDGHKCYHETAGSTWDIFADIRWWSAQVLPSAPAHRICDSSGWRAWRRKLEAEG